MLTVMETTRLDASTLMIKSLAKTKTWPSSIHFSLRQKSHSITETRERRSVQLCATVACPNSKRPSRRSSKSATRLRRDAKAGFRSRRTRDRRNSGKNAPKSPSRSMQLPTVPAMYRLKSLEQLLRPRLSFDLLGTDFTCLDRMIDWFSVGK